LKEELIGSLIEELRNITQELRLLRQAIALESVVEDEGGGADDAGKEKVTAEKKEEIDDHKKALIITDSDIDGILSATAICLENSFSGENSKVIFSNALHIHNFTEEAKKDIYGRVYVADIGINNREPWRTWTFLEAIENKLVKWYDHHRGWKELIRRKFVELGEKDPEILGFVVDENAECCTELITTNELLIRLARESDNPTTGIMSNLTTIIKNANNLDPRDYYTKYEIMSFACDYGLGHDVHDCKFFYRLNEKSARYMDIDEETHSIVKNGELRGNVLLLAQKGKRIDITKAMFEGYKIADYVVVKIKRAEGSVCKACGEENPPIVDDDVCANCGSKMIGTMFKETFFVGTKHKDIDLPKVFNLSSGYPHRVVLKGFTTDELVERLSSINAG